MSKLFALEEIEDQEGSGNDLLIDKLLDRKKEEVSPLSLTADLLKRRDEITKDIKEHIEAEDEVPEDEEGTEDESSEGEEETEPKGESDDNTDDNSSGEEEPSDDKKETKESKADPDDEGGEADSEEDLDGLIGSGLGGGDKEPQAEKKETATESFRHVPTLRNCFEPLRNTHNAYKVSLEAFGNDLKPTPETEQPIVYVKEAVLESIKNLTSIAFTYIDSNQTFTSKSTEAVTALNERLTVFTQMVQGGKYHFTHKLVSDKDILANISYVGHSSVRETVRALMKYINHSNKSSSTLLNSKFDELKSAFQTQEFNEDGTDLLYSKPIPGFNMVKASVVPYTNYLKTKIEDFQYYKLKVMKTEDLYNLPSISITEDKDIAYIVESLNELLVSLTISIDTLGSVTEHFNQFVDTLKVVAYNVSNDHFKNLAELGLDNKVKDFIRFKLVMEISYININLVMDYMTSVMSALNVALELKE